MTKPYLLLETKLMKGPAIRPAADSPLLDLEAIAARWGCSQDTARRPIERMQIPVVPVIRFVRVRLVDIEAAELGGGTFLKRAARRRKTD